MPDVVVVVPVVVPEVEVIEILDTSDESTVDWECAVADTVRRAAKMACCHCGFSFLGSS